MKHTAGNDIPSQKLAGNEYPDMTKDKKVKETDKVIENLPVSDCPFVSSPTEDEGNCCLTIVLLK